MTLEKQTKSSILKQDYFISVLVFLIQILILTLFS